MLTHYLFTSITRLSVLRSLSPPAAVSLYLQPGRFICLHLYRRRRAVLFTRACSFCSEYFLFRRVIKLLRSPFKFSRLNFTTESRALSISNTKLSLVYRYGFIEIHFPVERLFYLHTYIESSEYSICGRAQTKWIL